MWFYIQNKPDHNTINDFSGKRLKNNFKKIFNQVVLLLAKVKLKLNYAKRNWTKKLMKYQEQENILGNRNNYSKTDHDATFMRMKDVYM